MFNNSNQQPPLSQQEETPVQQEAPLLEDEQQLIEEFEALGMMRLLSSLRYGEGEKAGKNIVLVNEVLHQEQKHTVFVTSWEGHISEKEVIESIKRMMDYNKKSGSEMPYFIIFRASNVTAYPSMLKGRHMGSFLEGKFFFFYMSKKTGGKHISLEVVANYVLKALRVPTKVIFNIKEIREYISYMLNEVKAKKSETPELPEQHETSEQ